MVLTLYAKMSVDEKMVLDDYTFCSADVNEDGSVNGTDASAILSYYAHVSAKGGMSFEEFLKK